MESVKIYQKIMELTNDSKYSLYISKNLNNYAEMIWPYVANQSASDILEYVSCVPKALTKEAEKRLIEMGATDYFVPFIEIVDDADINKFLKYANEIKDYTCFGNVLEISLKLNRKFDKVYTRNVFITKSARNLKVAKLAATNTNIFGSNRKEIMQAVFKNKDLDVVLECAFNLAEESRNMYKFINEVHSIDSKDKITNELVKKYLLTNNQRLK